MATRQSGPLWASRHAREAIACARSPRGLRWISWQSILKVSINATKGELLLRVATCLSEGIVVKLPIVAVIVEDFHSTFGRVLLKGKLGGKWFGRQIVELEVDKAEMDVVLNEDDGALVARLGKFAFQLHVKTHFIQCHLVDGDTLSRFGCGESFIFSLGFFVLPGKLGLCPKKAACALGRQALGKLLWDLAIEGSLLELREAQVAKAVVPVHMLGLVVGGRKLGVFGFLGQWQGVKGKRPSLEDLLGFRLLRM
jgi:hypothetical protein